MFSNRITRRTSPTRRFNFLKPARLSAGLIAAALLAAPASAQWTPDTTLNTEVSWATQHTVETQIVKGPADGTYVLWDTVWAGGSVYLQFVDTNGFRMGSDTLVTNNGYDPVMTADGANGVIVAWRDASTNLLYVARYDAALGTPTWGPNLLTTSGQAAHIAIIGDGAGGAIVSWSHRPSFSSNYDIRAQRVDAAGTPQWTAGGFAVTNLSGSQQRFSGLTAGGAGGDAFIAWEDGRSGDTDIWVRYVDESGGGTWAVEQPVTTAIYTQSRPQLVSDGAGGAVIGWQDSRNGLGEPFAQKINGSGLHLWSPWNGIRVGQGGIYSSGWELGEDGAGGAVMAWSSYQDIRYQQITAAGSLFWGIDGLPITSGGNMFNHRLAPAIATDGAGGAVITWGTIHKTNSSIGDIFAQYVDPISGPGWTAGGITISDAADWQGLPDVVSNGECPAKVTFTDYRTDGDATIQRIVCPGIAGLIGFDVVHELHVGGSGTVDVIGWVDEAHADKGGFTLVFDPDIVDVVDVVDGTLQGLETRIDRDRGTVTVDFNRGGRLDRNRPLFSLKVRGAGEGSAALAFTRAELNRDLPLAGSASVITVNRR
ncbi:MAG: hypothetical protein AAGM22_06240 [Acidobacteriota bacterium]